MKKFLLIFTIIFSQFAFSQSDCGTALPTCGGSAISYTPTGPGLILEDLGGCLVADEHFSVWYTFTAATTGTLEFTITPNVFTDDYDFAVYGPNVPCGNLGGPIRCNFSGADGPTGLGMGATNPNGGGGTAAGQWSSALNVIAGETYFLVVDNYLSSANGFVMTFGGTASLTSPFLNPTIQPNPFIAPGPNADGEIIICTNPATFDFSTLSTGIVNGNPNFTVTYHLTANAVLTNTAPITTAINVNTTATYYYGIHYTDPNNVNNPANKCTLTGTITFKQGAIVVNDATLTACSNNNSGVGLYNLTTANVYTDPSGTSTFQYYPSLSDMNAGTNIITNPTNYTSAQGDVYVKVTTAQGCTGSSKITLAFFPAIVQTPVTLVSCFIEGNFASGLFDLTTANVTTTAGVTKKYYISMQDAITQNNAIANPAAYISSSSEVFVRITSPNQCWNVVKVILTVTPPKYSLVLKDKIICVEKVTTLDAGSGFTGYHWSTGATTQVISDVTVGTYFVDLTTGLCTTRQTVKVIASPIPVVTNIEVTNSTATVFVNGGTPPYKYSLDGITYQDSNIFNELPRGQNYVFVKDFFDCVAVKTNLTIPNLVNAITPNGDNINDFVDYSALAYKKNVVFSVYDRYGNKIHVGDKNNLYRWAGTVNGGKKVVTGTYWYTITWNEPTGNSEVKYSGWIMVKNRE